MPSALVQACDPPPPAPAPTTPAGPITTHAGLIWKQITDDPAEQGTDTDPDDGQAGAPVPAN